MSDIQWTKIRAGHYEAANGLMTIVRDGKWWRIVYRVVTGEDRGQWVEAGAAHHTFALAKAAAEPMVQAIRAQLNVDWRDAVIEDIAHLAQDAIDLGVPQEKLDALKVEIPLDGPEPNYVRIRAMVREIIEDRRLAISREEDAADLAKDARDAVDEAWARGYEPEEFAQFVVDTGAHQTATWNAWTVALGQAWVEATIRMYENRHAEAEYARN